MEGPVPTELQTRLSWDLVLTPVRPSPPPALLLSRSGRSSRCSRRGIIVPGTGLASDLPAGPRSPRVPASGEPRV